MMARSSLEAGRAEQGRLCRGVSVGGPWLCSEMSSHRRISSREIIPSDAHFKRFTLAAILRRGLRLGEGGVL